MLLQARADLTNESAHCRTAFQFEAQIFSWKLLMALRATRAIGKAGGSAAFQAEARNRESETRN